MEGKKDNRRRFDQLENPGQASKRTKRRRINKPKRLVLWDPKGLVYDPSLVERNPLSVARRL